MLPALASTADLAARNITVPATMTASVALDTASTAVRDAAGCSISYGTSTVTLVAWDPYELDLPAGPVASVASVTVAGQPVTGWTKVGDTLYLPLGWTDNVPALPDGSGSVFPVEVTVTYTHGYQVVPSDIVDLVCAMAAMMFATNGDYAGQAQVTSFRLGDYAETRQRPPGTESPSPLAVPTAVRDQLRARFGTGVVAVGLRSP